LPFEAQNVLLRPVAVGLHGKGINKAKQKFAYSIGIGRCFNVTSWKMMLGSGRSCVDTKRSSLVAALMSPLAFASQFGTRKIIKANLSLSAFLWLSDSLFRSVLGVSYK
jgi:hypothetical protein